ncbi:phosphotyrosine protein phosphatase [Colletotrichum karsti]|uniref:Phosphotyrosine protein phosphatase n=1 Tax=Colletotrichum karsti TaxID=1095194 RepID=A0A9P6LLP6_9PEZI|nr:phosphotyrosine protein phosphatase [Colletotrichum karsti]KAF9880634.1 phosphotyrosine protein phosphatase [Colletotrichum karsti]
MPEQPVSVLFVCLGNICRSTMAEGIFRDIAQKPPYKGLIAKVDSCGTAAYHVGDPPDERTMMTLEDNGIMDYRHAGRKISAADFNKFDYIFAMDRSNLQDIQRLQQREQRANSDPKAKVMLFGEFSGGQKPEVVSDPYYGGGEGFSRAYEQCTRFSANFLKQVFPDVDPKA